MADKLVYVLNGPNLNLLGLREPEIYGTQTLDDIAAMLEDAGQSLGIAIDMRQSNHEGHLVDWLHEAQAEGAHAVLLNAGAYTHTSIALLDALVEDVDDGSDLVYRHRWREGDLVLIDNRACLHQAMRDYDPEAGRVMHRIIVADRAGA